MSITTRAIVLTTMPVEEIVKVRSILLFQSFLNLISLVCILPCLDGYSTDGLCQECLISDVCIATQPCQNDGTCTTIGDGEYNCSCTDTWSGAQCTECAVENCVQCALTGCVECVAGYNVDLDTRQCGQCKIVFCACHLWSLLPRGGAQEPTRSPLTGYGLLLIPLCSFLSTVNL